MTIKIFNKNKDIQPHGELISQIFRQNIKGFAKTPKIIEVGSGITTDFLNRLSLTYKCEVISIDNNSSKVKFLNDNIKNISPKLSFKVGDSLKILKNIVENSKIDLLFLDSAPSAIHTFKEFLICENALKSGSCLIIDNAKFPEEKIERNPARKGKIIVPYLLASKSWEVFSYPLSGDMMIVAMKRSEKKYADINYELDDYSDNWRNELGSYF
tara:strand:+ start:496 stop:1134 length:639 start_codon:yes stop_codon:yes gene_type:complete